MRSISDLDGSKVSLNEIQCLNLWLNRRKCANKLLASTNFLGKISAENFNKFDKFVSFAQAKCRYLRIEKCISHIKTASCFRFQYGFNSFCLKIDQAYTL